MVIHECMGKYFKSIGIKTIFTVYLNNLKEARQKKRMPEMQKQFQFDVTSSQWYAQKPPKGYES